MKLGLLACYAGMLALSGCSVTVIPPSKPIERRAVNKTEQSTVIVAVPATFETNVVTGRQCENPMVVPALGYGAALRLVKAEGGNVLVVYRANWPAYDTEDNVYGKHVRCPEAVLAGLRSKGKVNEP